MYQNMEDSSIEMSQKNALIFKYSYYIVIYIKIVVYDSVV